MPTRVIILPCNRIIDSLPEHISVIDSGNGAYRLNWIIQEEIGVVVWNTDAIVRLEVEGDNNAD